jgi:hypothetical protein
MLQGNKIDCEDEVKLLGVTFDFKLTFNSHVSHICKKEPLNKYITLFFKSFNNIIYIVASIR